MFKTTLTIAALMSVGIAAAQPDAPMGSPDRPPHFEIDVNNDGWVTRSEAEATAKAHFNRIDRDSDGKLRPEDHMQRHEVRLRHSRDSADRAEESKPSGRRPRMGPPPMMVLMSAGEADTNGDGSLSEAEFVALHLRFFNAADVNGDGKVAFEPPPSPPKPPQR